MLAKSVGPTSDTTVETIVGLYLKGNHHSRVSLVVSRTLFDKLEGFQLVPHLIHI